MIANGPKINQASTQVLSKMKKRLDACYCSIHDYRKLDISVPCTKALETLRLAAFFGDSNKVNYIFNNLLGFYELNKSSDSSKNNKIKDESDGYYSALYAASKNGYLDIVKTFLTHENAKKATSKEIATAFRFAFRNNQPHIVDYFMESYLFDIIAYFEQNKKSLNDDELDYALSVMFKLSSYDAILELMAGYSARLSTKALKEIFAEFQTLDSNNLTHDAKTVLNRIETILQERGEHDQTIINASFKQLDSTSFSSEMLDSLLGDLPELLIPSFTQYPSRSSVHTPPAPSLQDISGDDDAVRAQDELVEKLKNEGVSEEDIAAIMLAASEDTTKRRNTF